MAELSLREAVELGLARELRGDGAQRFGGIRHDSRRVQPGDMFAAIAGERRHGSEFAPEAIARGAVAVLCERPFDAGVPLLLADDVLVALSALAQRLYDDPTRGLSVVGITGTNGKTTTAYLVEAILLAAGRKPAVLGTVSFRGPAGVRPATHTTPMADDLMRLSRWAVDSGATDLVLEVSSHGLAMHRVDCAHFEVAAFTNLTHDHLDYHGDLASYERAKRRLFEQLGPKHSVLNVDDPVGASLTQTAAGRIWRCSRRADAQAEIRVLQHDGDAQGIRARVATPAGELALHSPLVGEHNLENLLIALGCGLALSLSPDAVLRGLAGSRGAPGRLERVDAAEIAVFVDYAHTPDALQRVLLALRPVTRGRLLLVFGCGGDRDRAKRPLMGRVAAELAELAIATSDNPRGEPPEQILAEIEPGLVDGGAKRLQAAELAGAARGYHVCSDRRRAIELAVQAARPGDSVLIAGKGHEKVQIADGRREPFDDVEQARRALGARAGAG